VNYGKIRLSSVRLGQPWLDRDRRLICMDFRRASACVGSRPESAMAKKTALTRASIDALQ
jgi:hypothetical protein